MRPPFTVQEFFAVFARYNEAVWPMQLPLLLLAFLMVALIYSDGKLRSRAVNLIMAFLWIWMAVAYHLETGTGCPYPFGLINSWNGGWSCNDSKSMSLSAQVSCLLEDSSYDHERSQRSPDVIAPLASACAR